MHLVLAVQGAAQGVGEGYAPTSNVDVASADQLQAFLTQVRIPAPALAAATSIVRPGCGCTCFVTLGSF